MQNYVNGRIADDQWVPWKGTLKATSSLSSGMCGGACWHFRMDDEIDDFLKSQILISVRPLSYDGIIFPMLILMRISL